VSGKTHYSAAITTLQVNMGAINSALHSPKVVQGARVVGEVAQIRFQEADVPAAK